MGWSWDVSGRDSDANGLAGGWVRAGGFLLDGNGYRGRGRVRARVSPRFLRARGLYLAVEARRVRSQRSVHVLVELVRLAWSGES